MPKLDPLSEKVRLANSPIREREVDDFSDKVTNIIKTQDIEPIMKTIHAIPDLAYRKRSTQTASRLLGSIPTVIALKWAKKSGTRLYSREFFAYARKQLLTNPDYISLRVRRN